MSTPRERAVLDLLATGYLYKKIAQHLEIGYRTVHTHIERIYRKLHVKSRAQAVATYHEL
jgi:DNA-binding NarL/FixJ family response regulator